MRRRGRGQHRKPGQHHHHHHHQGRNQSFDSNGPGVRLRGTAHQIYEKYLMLGRDSAASGDRIMSENYFQHADHFYRIILVNQGPLEQFSERHDGQDPDIDAETGGYGQGEQPASGDGQQPQTAYGSTVPQAQGFNGAGPSQGTSLPGSNQPRGEGQREGRGDGDNRGEGHQGGQGQQHHGNFRRDRFNRRFRNRDDRGGQYQDQGGDRGDRNDRGERREGRDERGNRDRDDRNDRQRDHRPQRQEDEAFEPPAFLKAERPAGETPPRDPFNRDDEQR